MGCGCCKEQFKIRKFLLDHDNVSDFYLSSCQSSDSALVLLWVRAVLLGICLLVEIGSIVIWTLDVGFPGYLLLIIYLSRWCRVGVMLSIGISLVISCIAHYKGPIEPSTSLPWYVKIYWALFNITISLSFFLSIYNFLAILGGWGIIDFGEMSGQIMVIQLVTSRHPVYVLHFYWPLLVAIIYTIFSAAFHYSGETDPSYLSDPLRPLDWKESEDMVAQAFACYIGVVIIHLTLVSLASMRDCITNRCRSGPVSGN